MIIPKRTRPTIQNVVSIFMFIGRIFDLRCIAMLLCGKFSEDVFPTVVGICAETETVYGICRTGHVITTGSKTPEFSILTAMLLSQKLTQAYTIQFQYTGLFYPNIVCHASLGYGLKIEEIQRDFQSSCSWKPSLFLGMSLDLMIGEIPIQQKVTFIIFPNGQVNMTGIKRIEDLPEIEQKLFTVFKPYAIYSTDSNVNHNHNHCDILPLSEFGIFPESSSIPRIKLEIEEEKTTTRKRRRNTNTYKSSMNEYYDSLCDESSVDHYEFKNRFKEEVDQFELISNRDK